LNKAIKDTEGEILMYKGGPIAAYYHAVCGGKTIPIETAWPHKDRLPYLVGADDNGYCSWAKTYAWVEIFGPETIQNNLKRYFIEFESGFSSEFNDIIDIEFLKDIKTGRMLEMQIFTDSGIHKIKCDQIRWALGRPSRPGTILPSTRFSVDKIYEDGHLQGMVVKGFGNGHGVGACQCGLIGRAREGQDYDEMLKTYYTGVELVKIY
jgi:stage II sporulation protein D